jgi:hypothetical protein
MATVSFQSADLSLHSKHGCSIRAVRLGQDISKH